MIPAIPVAAELRYTLQPESHWVVSAGEEVRRGTVLARGRCYEHAAAPGRVIDVDGRALVLRTDGDATEVTLPPLDFSDRPAVLERIREAGIRGLGGAGFPTHLKLLAAVRNGVHTLVVNAVECEPGIRCDAALIEAATPVIREGIDIVRNLLGVRNVLIGCSPATRLEHSEAITTCIDPVQPADGAERYLLHHLTGAGIPRRSLPVDHGFVVLNVGTLHAIARAIAGEPLVERVVTVFGENRRVPIGTPLTFLGGPDRQGFRVGGELAGRTVAATAAVDKPTNAVDRLHHFTNLPCIRCGACDPVCPEELPVSLLISRADDTRQASRRDDSVLDCIACGLCNPVCPSGIDIVGQLRSARHRAREHLARSQAATRAMQRSTWHAVRSLQREAEQVARRAERLARLGPPTGNPPIANPDPDQHA